jgi:hypothetical protein
MSLCRAFGSDVFDLFLQITTTLDVFDLSLQITTTLETRIAKENNIIR